MFKLLELLFHGCIHKWDTTEVINLYDNVRPTGFVGRAYYLRCQKCGRVKRHLFSHYHW